MIGKHSVPEERRSLPVALTIAGSDSGGGAGIQTDLRAFAAVGAHGTSVVTCVTAQNPRRILGIQACTGAMVRQQLAAVFEELPPQAIKTGMLYSGEIIEVVVKFLKALRKHPPLIVDPVSVATSGRRLLQSEALKVLRGQLLPMATLVTPNLPEAEALTGMAVREPEEMRRAARMIRDQFGCAALVKGGHLEGCREAVDIFYDGRTELMLSAPFIKGLRLHGTGCADSAGITAFLALGSGLPEAVRQGKDLITRAIAGSARVHGHNVLELGS